MEKTDHSNNDNLEMAPKKKQHVYNRRYSAKKGVSNLIENNPNVKNKKKRSVAPQTQVQATLNNGSEDTLITPKSDLTIAISKAELSAGY